MSNVTFWLFEFKKFNYTGALFVIILNLISTPAMISYICLQ